MRKGWQSRKINENAWGLKFTRWYFIAPSGNKYKMWRGCYFPRIYIATSLRSMDKPDDYSDELIECRTYLEAMKYIYETEDKGGFIDHIGINHYLDSDKEMNFLFGQQDKSYKWYSMP